MPTEVVKAIGFTNVFARTKASTKTIIVNVGGAGSSKSRSVAQLIVYKLLNEQNKVFGVCRKTFPALRMTAMAEIIALLKTLGVYREEAHNKTANTYTHNSNFIWFFSIDEADKIKSLNLNYIWVEEANEISWEDYIILKLRLRAPTPPGERNQIYLTLNPSDSTNWIPKKLTGLDNTGIDPDVEVIHSTYTDNPFLSKEYVKVIEDLILQDENYYNVYAKGLWGRLEGKIYSNYSIIPALPSFATKRVFWAYGLDFGWSSISALVRVILCESKVYAEEVFYQTGMTVADIIESLSHQVRGDIYGDPSSKQAIKEIAQAGYIAFEGTRNVKESIDLCKRQIIYIPQTSTHLIEEAQSYHWKKNPQATGSEDAFLPEPVKFKDHAMDSMRYGIWGVVTRFGAPTAIPKNLEPIKSLDFGRGTNDKVLERWMHKDRV